MNDGWYATVSKWVAGVAGIITFFAAWFSFGTSYGLLGIALGWFPAGFLAAFAGLIAALLWPLAVLAAGVLAVLAMRAVAS